MVEITKSGVLCFAFLITLFKTKKTAMPVVPHIPHMCLFHGTVVGSQRWALKLQPPHAPEQKWSMTEVGGAWKIREWKERKVCSGPSAETQRDQLRWRGWMRPFTAPYERAPAGPRMRVGPSAHIGVHKPVTSKITQEALWDSHPSNRLGFAWKPGASISAWQLPQRSKVLSALNELRVKSTLRDTPIFLKERSCQQLSHVKTSRHSRHLLKVWDSALWTFSLKDLFVLVTYAIWVTIQHIR